MEQELNEALFKIFQEGVLFGAKTRELQDLSESEIKQRCRHKFDSVINEMG